MTTKIITGTCSAGYSLVAGFGAVSITASDDGSGVFVTATAPPFSASLHAIIAAMAGLGAGAGSAVAAPMHRDALRPMLAAPSTQLA
jgi:hypothetical protein